MANEEITVTPRMGDSWIRLQCLGVAAQTMGFRHETPEEVIETAAKYEKFVMGDQTEETPSGEDG